MAKMLSLFVIAALFYTAVGGAHPPQGNRQLFSIDDVLQLESIPSTVIDPMGRRIAMLHRPPYEHSYKDLAGPTFGTILIVDLVQRRAVKIQPFLPDLIGTGKNKIIGFSPSGRRLAFYSLELGGAPEFRIGVFDFFDNKLVWLPEQAHWHNGAAYAVWLNDDTIIYNANAEGDTMLPMPDKETEEARRRLNAAWMAKQLGSRTTAKVAYETEEKTAGVQNCRPGRLMAYDFSRKKARKLTDHTVENIAQIEGGRKLVGSAYCGIVSRAGIPATNKTANVRIIPTSIDLNAVVPVKFLCNECNMKYDSLQISPDQNEIAFYNYGSESRPERATLARYNLSSGEYNEYRLDGIVPMALDVRVDFSKRSPIVWIDNDLAIYAAAAEAKITDVQRPYRKAAMNIRRDWYRITAKNGMLKLTGDLLSVSEMPVASNGEILILPDAEGFVKVSSQGVISKKGLAELNNAIPIRDLSNMVEQAQLANGPYVANRLVFFQKNKEYLREILAYDLNSEVVHSLTKVPKEYLLSSLGGGGQVAIWQADNDGSTVVAYTNVAEKNIMPPKEIMRLNRHLSHVLMPEQVNLRYKGPDGDEYNSCLLMPPPDMVRRPLPTIVEVYPFATGSCYGATSPYWHNPFVWPSAGYAYLRVGVHTGVRHPITKEFLDMRRWIYPAIDKAVEQGYADNNKLALIGISQGSIVALEVLTKSKRFGVSLVAHGMANYSSLWGEFGFASSSLYFDRFPPGMEMPRFEDPTNVLWLGGAPWEEADSYTKITPLYSASQIQTPIFFLHSDVDSFNLSHFQEMYAALHRLDKPVTMVYYEGEAHGLDSPANIRDAYYRVTKWMGRHLEVFSAANPNKANAAR